MPKVPKVPRVSKICMDILLYFCYNVCGDLIMKTENKRKYEIILLLLRIISIIVIIGCLIYIGLWYIENRKNANMIKDLSDSSIIETVYVDVPAASIDENGNEETEVTKVAVYELNFDKLFSINDSTVGWINVPNTTIDYPVTKHSDNAFYLNHSFGKSRNSAGWIFADYRNKFDGTDKNIIIYGHNRMDASMFATLKDTQTPNWYNNSANRYITFVTPSATHIYEVFSVYTIKSETFYLTTDFADGESFLDFANTLKKRSIHDFGVPLSETDSTTTLSTCDATGRSRVILHAKQIM